MDKSKRYIPMHGRRATRWRFKKCNISKNSSVSLPGWALSVGSCLACGGLACMYTRDGSWFTAMCELRKCSLPESQIETRPPGGVSMSKHPHKSTFTCTNVAMLECAFVLTCKVILKLRIVPLAIHAGFRPKGPDFCSTPLAGSRRAYCIAWTAPDRFHPGLRAGRSPAAYPATLAR
jgi:hypothetical protein